MNLKQLTVATVCIGSMLASCQKEKPMTTQQATKQSLKAATTIGSFFVANQNNATQYFLVDPQLGATLTGSQGTQMIIAPGAFVSGSNPVTAQVQVALVENYTLSNMLLNNMSTESLLGEAIVTGGSFIIDFSTQSGVPVTFAPGTINMVVPAANTGGIDPGMTLWKGVASIIQSGDNAWSDQGNAPQLAGTTYDFPLIPGEKWVNVDRRFFGDISDLRVVMPQGFDLSNTSVFVAMNGVKNMLTSLDVYTEGNNSFSEPIPFSAPGQQGHIIAVTVKDGILRTKIQPFTVSPNQVIQLSNLTANTVAGLQDQIDALP